MYITEHETNLISGTIARRTSEYGGTTYNPRTDLPAWFGYAVAEYPDLCKIVPNDGQIIEHISDFLADTRETLAADTLAHVGTWLNTDDDQIYLDIVRLYKDEQEAAQRGREHGEIAIYCLHESKEIRL